MKWPILASLAWVSTVFCAAFFAWQTWEYSGGPGSTKMAETLGRGTSFFAVVGLACIWGVWLLKYKTPSR